jgi:uncharacterized DUF497 family protein
MVFEFDRKKSDLNLQKHGIDFVSAQKLWKNKIVQLKVTEFPEERYLNFGVLDGKHWTAVITYRGTNIRIISVRRAAKKEAEYYENAIKR